MASENETIEEIVNELRNEPLAADGAKPWLHYLADRIEAAYRREKAYREMLDSNLHAITEDAVIYNEYWDVNTIVEHWRCRPISVHTEREESARLDRLHNAYYAEIRRKANEQIR